MNIHLKTSLILSGIVLMGAGPVVLATIYPEAEGLIADTVACGILLAIMYFIIWSILNYRRWQDRGKK